MGAQLGLIVASALTLWAASVFEARGIKKNRSQATILAGCVGLFIWTAVNAVSLVAQLLAGSTLWELGIPLSQFLSTLGLFAFATVIASRRGHLNWRKWWRGLKPVHGVSIGLCALGVGAGFYFDDPFVTLWGNVFANAAGLAPVFFSGRAEPGEVTREYWALRGLSSAIATAVFLISGNDAGLIPSLTGMVLACVMLYVSRPQQPSFHVRQAGKTDPSLATAGGLRFII